MVRDVYGGARPPADQDRLVEGVFDVCHLVAQMRDIRAPATGENRCQRDDLSGVGVGSWWIDQPGRHAGATAGEFPVQNAAHGIQFCAGRRSIVVTHHRAAQGGVPDQRGQMVRSSSHGVGRAQLSQGGKRLNVFVEHRADLPAQGCAMGSPHVREQRRSAVPRDLGGHPLTNGGQDEIRIGVRPERNRIGMRVRIDEPRCHAEATDVDRDRAVREFIRCNDPAAGDPNISMFAFRPSAVENQAAANQQRRRASSGRQCRTLLRNV